MLANMEVGGNKESQRRKFMHFVVNETAKIRIDVSRRWIEYIRSIGKNLS